MTLSDWEVKTCQKKSSLPPFFEEFVEPYDAILIAAVHSVGQRIVYNTCGANLPILEMIVEMAPDAVEIFSPAGLDGEMDLHAIKRRIGNQVCIIGGFDHIQYLQGCTNEETRKAVRRCFEEAGEDGGYILAPSGQLFHADLYLLRAFTEEARECRYDAAPVTGEMASYEFYTPCVYSPVQSN